MLFEAGVGLGFEKERRNVESVVFEPRKSRRVKRIWTVWTVCSCGKGNRVTFEWLPYVLSGRCT